MTCYKCGYEMPDNAEMCFECGASANPKDNNKPLFAFDDIPHTYLRENRRTLTYIILSFFTCGLYGWYFIWKIGDDMDLVCTLDAKAKTVPKLGVFLFLCLITCGLYIFYWYYVLGDQMERNAYRYGLEIKQTGFTYIILWLLGSLTYGITAYVAMYLFVKNTNLICRGYNKKYNTPW